MKNAESNTSPLLNISQRVLVTLEDGRLTDIKLVPDQGYVVTSENAATMLPYLEKLLLTTKKHSSSGDFVEVPV